MIGNHTGIPADWTGGLQLKAGPHFIGLYQPSPETAGFWQGVQRGELMLKWCNQCERCFHPKRIICTNCGSDELGWRKSAGRGKIYSYSEVHHPPHPAFAASIPYTLGIVALEEDVRLFTRLIHSSGPTAIGSPVRVDFRVLEENQLLPVFVVEPGP